MSPIDPLLELPGYSLRRISIDAMAQLARRLAPLDLTPVDASVLIATQANWQITQTAICRVLGMASANLAPIIRRFEKSGWIERQPINGRSHMLRLSPAGRTLANQAHAEMLKHEENLLNRLPAHLRTPFIEALQNLWPPAQEAGGSGETD